MKKILISIFLFINLLYADDISTLISNIKNAPSSQKRTLINQLKLKLRNTNEKQRSDAINMLRNAQHLRKINHNIQEKNTLHNNITTKIHIENNTNKLVQIKQQKGKMNH